MAHGTDLQRTIKAFVRRGDKYYVVECMGINVGTQGTTLDETITNLQVAVALYLEDANLEELGLMSDPALLVTLEIEPHPRVA